MHCAGRSAKRPAHSKETPSMLADFEDVLDKLEVASRNGEKAMCFCPAHDGTHLEPEPREQEAIALVVRLRDRGLSLRSIAESLAENGHAPRCGPWHPQKIANILA